METTFGRPIIDALYEEGSTMNAKLEVFFERQTAPHITTLQKGLLFVSLKTLQNGGIGRVFFPETGHFSDLWAAWDYRDNTIKLFVFSGCERVVIATAAGFRELSQVEECCGNFEDDDIVEEIEDDDDLYDTEYDLTHAGTDPDRM